MRKALCMRAKREGSFSRKRGHRGMDGEKGRDYGRSQVTRT